MKLIVGLGNPGEQYSKTRHNVGFNIIDEFCKTHGLKLNKDKFNGIYTKFIHNGQDVLIAKPMTYMNLSGDFVRQITNYYKIDAADVLVIHDDKDFEVGKFKYKVGGSSAGQNGINDIIFKLATDNFCRLRVGIGQPTIAIKDFVLSKFKPEEQEKLNSNNKKLIESIEYFISNSIKSTMDKYNNG